MGGWSCILMIKGIWRLRSTCEQECSWEEPYQHPESGKERFWSRCRTFFCCQPNIFGEIEGGAGGKVVSHVFQPSWWLLGQHAIWIVLPWNLLEQRNKSGLGTMLALPRDFFYYFQWEVRMHSGEDWSWSYYFVKIESTVGSWIIHSAPVKGMRRRMPCPSVWGGRIHEGYMWGKRWSWLGWLKVAGILCGCSYELHLCVGAWELWVLLAARRLNALQNCCKSQCLNIEQNALLYTFFITSLVHDLCF